MDMPWQEISHEKRRSDCAAAEEMFHVLLLHSAARFSMFCSVHVSRCTEKSCKIDLEMESPDFDSAWDSSMEHSRSNGVAAPDYESWPNSGLSREQGIPFLGKITSVMG